MREGFRGFGLGLCQDTLSPNKIASVQAFAKTDAIPPVIPSLIGQASVLASLFGLGGGVVRSFTFWLVPGKRYIFEENHIISHDETHSGSFSPRPHPPQPGSAAAGSAYRFFRTENSLGSRPNRTGKNCRRFNHRHPARSREKKARLLPHQPPYPT